MSFAPAIGSGEMQHYFSTVAYMALVGLMTCLAVALFGIFSLLAKTFKSEDIAVMQAAARKARVPEPLVELAGKIASFGVAAG